MTGIVLFLYRVCDFKHLPPAYEKFNFAPASCFARLRVLYFSISSGNRRCANQGIR